MADQSSAETLPFRSKYDLEVRYPFGNEFVTVKANAKDLRASFERELLRWGFKDGLDEDRVKRNAEMTKFVFSDEKGRFWQYLPESLSRSSAARIRVERFAQCEIDISKVVAEVDKRTKGREMRAEERHAALLNNLGGFWNSTRFALIAQAHEWKGVATAYQSITSDNTAQFLITFSLAAVLAITDKDASPASKVWNTMWITGASRTLYQLIMVGSSFIPNKGGRPIGEVKPISIPRKDDPLPFQITFEK